MSNDPRYTPSDVFETFPRPAPVDRLAQIGRTLDEERREIMLRRHIGLTKLYNLVNDPALADPDVGSCRVQSTSYSTRRLDAYGWSDISLPMGSIPTEKCPVGL